MKANIITEEKVLLTMTREEANWLRKVVQNPINSDFENEDPIDSEMRRKFFDCLCSR